MTLSLRQSIRDLQSTRRRWVERVLKREMIGYTPTPAYLAFLRVHYPMIYLALMTKREDAQRKQEQVNIVFSLPV
ncbi:MAG: hypothetical protein NC930_04685 [Candidatus Omnitrophica bacterium]|nr:hypothetical protein [Candidatus Omnitrophota bacterium]